MEEEKIPGKMLNRKIMMKLMNAIQESKPPYNLTRMAELMDMPDSTLESYFRLLKDNKFATVALDFSRKLLNLKYVIAIIKGKWLDSSPLKDYWLVGRFHTSIGTILTYYFPSNESESINSLKEITNADVYQFYDVYNSRPDWLYYYDEENDKLYDIDKIYKMIDNHPPINYEIPDPHRKPDALDVLILAALGANALDNYRLLIEAFKGPSPIRKFKPFSSFNYHLNHSKLYSRGGAFLPKVGLNSFNLRLSEPMPFTSGYILLRGTNKNIQYIFKRLLAFPFVGQILVGDNVIYFNYVIHVKYFDTTIVNEYKQYDWDEVLQFNLMGHDVKERYLLPFREYNPVLKEWIPNSNLEEIARRKLRLSEFENWYNKHYLKNIENQE
ncbi:MAG: hypothetical protein ACP5I6_00250 [Caldisphaera sp.]|nr:MAG: hypothetical protein C0201_00250 [Caldisphaera sp.]PMP89490.1 MAG: hypothetical protein C0171_07160 [Caldisphaera sp.]